MIQNFWWEQNLLCEFIINYKLLHIYEVQKKKLYIVVLTVRLSNCIEKKFY